MRSPGSGQEMIIVEVNGVELDVCPAGTGVWFDADELRQLFMIVGAPEELLELDQRLERLPKRLAYDMTAQTCDYMEINPKIVRLDHA